MIIQNKNSAVKYRRLLTVDRPLFAALNNHTCEIIDFISGVNMNKTLYFI